MSMHHVIITHASWYVIRTVNRPYKFYNGMIIAYSDIIVVIYDRHNINKFYDIASSRVYARRDNEPRLIDGECRD